MGTRFNRLQRCVLANSVRSTTIVGTSCAMGAAVTAGSTLTAVFVVSTGIPVLVILAGGMIYSIFKYRSRKAEIRGLETFVDSTFDLEKGLDLEESINRYLKNLKFMSPKEGFRHIREYLLDISVSPEIFSDRHKIFDRVYFNFNKPQCFKKIN